MHTTLLHPMRHNLKIWVTSTKSLPKHSTLRLRASVCLLSYQILQSVPREVCISAFSKLAVILWTRELQNRLDAEAAPIIVTSVHPGVADTSKDKLPSLIKPLGFLIMKLFFKNPNVGSHTSVIAAASPDVRKNADKYKGAYLEPVGKVTQPSKVAQNAELSHELWATVETFLSNIGLN